MNKLRRLEDPAVGGQLVAHFQDDHIADHDVSHRDGVELAAAHHLSAQDVLLSIERLEFPVAFVFTGKSNARRQDDGDHHRQAFHQDMPVGQTERKKNACTGEHDRRNPVPAPKNHCATDDNPSKSETKPSLQSFSLEEVDDHRQQCGAKQNPDDRFVELGKKLQPKRFARQRCETVAAETPHAVGNRFRGEANFGIGG